MRPFSSILVDGPERAAARAMLYPVGFTDEDFKKPIIGIGEKSLAKGEVEIKPRGGALQAVKAEQAVEAVMKLVNS